VWWLDEKINKNGFLNPEKQNFILEIKVPDFITALKR